MSTPRLSVVIATWNRLQLLSELLDALNQQSLGSDVFEVIVVDPRSAFSTEARFPGVQRSTVWPDRALEALGLDPDA